MDIRVTGDIHGINFVVEWLLNHSVHPILYFPKKWLYKRRGLTGYFRGIKESTGKPGKSLITISYRFPNRFEIFGVDSGEKNYWLGKDYKLVNGDLL